MAIPEYRCAQIICPNYLDFSLAKVAKNYNFQHISLAKFAKWSHPLFQIEIFNYKHLSLAKVKVISDFMYLSLAKVAKVCELCRFIASKNCQNVPLSRFIANKNHKKCNHLSLPKVKVIQYTIISIYF